MITPIIIHHLEDVMLTLSNVDTLTSVLTCPLGNTKSRWQLQCYIFTGPQWMTVEHILKLIGIQTKCDVLWMRII